MKGSSQANGGFFGQYSGKANLASNPNISVNTNPEYSRSPLSRLVAQAGMLNRAMDLVTRQWRPEINRGEPLPTDPEIHPNPFSAENRPHDRSEWRHATTVFLQMYKKMRDVADKYRQDSNLLSPERKKVDRDYRDDYKKGGYQKPPMLITYGQKTDKEKARSVYSVKSLSETVKRNFAEYFKKEYKAANDDKKIESLYAKSVSVLSKIYDLASKAKSYVENVSYDGRSKQRDEDRYVTPNPSYVAVAYFGENAVSFLTGHQANSDSLEQTVELEQPLIVGLESRL